MSGECDKRGEHALECLCPLPIPRNWISREEAKEMFPLDVLGIDEDKFCSKCKNELIACVC